VARHSGIVIAALTWNLAHGRDFPPDPSLLTWRSRILRAPERGGGFIQVNQPLRRQFIAWLALREWEIALLQEVPPRWQSDLAAGTGAGAAIALTSRNSFAPLRALAAEHNPDLIASNEGGSNQILVRAPARILQVRRLTLTQRPERRRMLWTLIEVGGGRRLAAANLHATSDDRAASAREVETAAERAVDWAGDVPLVFGGDFNLRPRENPGPFERLRERFGLREPTAPGSLDHVLGRGLEVVRRPARLDRDIPGPEGLRIRLSDHAPVVASFGMK
jgi:endonuclease/exonuclease/phosphatase family metal-dependent hydrolase